MTRSLGVFGQPEPFRDVKSIDDIVAIESEPYDANVSAREVL